MRIISRLKVNNLLYFQNKIRGKCFKPRMEMRISFVATNRLKTNSFLSVYARINSIQIFCSIIVQAEIAQIHFTILSYADPACYYIGRPHKQQGCLGY